LAGAVNEARQSLALEPSPIVRYNLAAWLANQGDLEAAAVELRTALSDGAADPRTVLDDPDFVPHLGDPRFAFLPQSPIRLELTGPDGTVFSGGDARVTLVVTGQGLSAVGVDSPALEGPFRLTDVEERRERSTDGDSKVSWTWTWKALGAGTATAGPFTVTAGRSTEATESVVLVAVSAPDMDPEPPRRTTWRTPGEMRAGAPEEFGAWRVGTELRVQAGPNDTIQGGPIDAVRGTWWEGRDQVGRIVVGSGDLSAVRIVRAGQVVWPTGPVSGSR
jgi:hypothetical protein